MAVDKIGHMHKSGNQRRRKEQKRRHDGCHIINKIIKKKVTMSIDQPYLGSY